MTTKPKDVEVTTPLSDVTSGIESNNNNDEVKDTGVSDDNLKSTTKASVKADPEFHEIIKKLTMNMHGILGPAKDNEKGASLQGRATLADKYLLRMLASITTEGDQYIEKFEEQARKSIDAEIKDELEALKEEVAQQQQVDYNLSKMVESSAIAINKIQGIKEQKEQQVKLSKKRAQFKAEKQELESVQQDLTGIEEKVVAVAKTTDRLLAQVMEIKRKHKK